MKKRLKQMNIMYLPALALILTFVLYPLLRSFFLSFHNWNGYSPKKTFVGLDNYINLLSDKVFLRAFLNTLLYGFGSTLFQNILGLAFALFLNTKFKGHKIVRTIVYMPVMISGLIMGYVMYFVFRSHGALTQILSWFGIAGRDWLGDGNIGRFCILFVNSWQFCGLCMVIYLAGLQGISRQYLEAAAIDGASHFEVFRFITMPLLLPAVSSAVVINLIGGLKLYDVVVSLTDGGPNYATASLSYYINNRYMAAGQAGYASAVGVVMFLFILLVSNTATRYFRKKEIEQ